MAHRSSSAFSWISHSLPTFTFILHPLLFFIYLYVFADLPFDFTHECAQRKGYVADCSFTFMSIYGDYYGAYMDNINQFLNVCLTSRQIACPFTQVPLHPPPSFCK